jgi:hypothetical protein
MTSIGAAEVASGTRFDMGQLTKATIGLGCLLSLLSPLSPDMFAFAAGAFVPAIVVYIIDTPYMPAPIVFWLLWQWVQTFARAFVTIVDEQSMARSVFGPSVEEAYWYMLASIVVLAVSARLVLGNIRPASDREENWHLNWRPVDLFIVYLASFALAIASAKGYGSSFYQQLDTLAKFKFAAEFVFFAVVLTTGKGYRLLLVALGMELVIGFTGLLSEFRSVFIVLAIAALAARVRISTSAALAGAGWAVILIGLSLFWTAIKMDYRDFATGATSTAEDTQALTASFDDRLGYIGGRALSPDEIDWSLASYTLLLRLAYVDTFGQVIAVNQFFGGDDGFQQWSDALGHVFQPRILFPDKPALKDSEVYLKLTRADPSEILRESTSISVGYMGENYADMQFPGMLVGIFVVGLVVSGATRYFMSTPLPWMLRQSVVMAYIYGATGTGVEVSLPKVLGTTIMFLAVYGVLIKVSFPMGMRWLDNRAKAARELEERQLRAASAAGAAARERRPDSHGL